MSRVAVWILAIAGLLALSGSPSHAGNNAGGTIGLSWDAAGDSVTGVAPGAAVFPLFLRLNGIPDLQQLAVFMRWVPYDSTGECYSIVPADSDATCGWVDMAPPDGGFGGDSSYTSSIHFPSGGTRNCAIYWVSTTTCDSTPSARFYIASA